MRKAIATLCFVLCICTKVISQDLVPPLDIPLFLSGNFGELRSNHFHSGIDFKTQSIIGFPVKSIKDGYVSRVGVSAWGYGNALYITHFDGTTSVYAHLDRFVSNIEDAVKHSQYTRETFDITLYFSPMQFPIKKGETIAYSGNSGSSGGPHVHFEIRDTKTEEILDPLPLFKDKIKDTRPPEILGLMIFPQFNTGIVNNSTKNKEVSLVKNKTRETVIRETISAWGDIGVGVKAYDKMNETSNIYGVYEVILKVDGKAIHHSVMDKFSFENTRYINSYIDFDEWTNNKSFFMKSFVEPGNLLGLNKVENNGIISINEERDYHLEYTLKDVYGNTSTLNFVIKGVKADIPTDNSYELCFKANQDNEYSNKGISLNIPQGNLYTDIYLNIDTISNFTPFGSLYKIGRKAPLHSYCSLTLDIDNDTFEDKSKYGIVYNWNDNRSWLGGEYLEGGKIKTKTRELGDFSIEIDTIAPRIRPTNETKWTSLQKISFIITDDLSGIATFNATLDGEFALFNFDGKRAYLYCTFDSERMKRGSQLLELTVTDGAGNKSVFRKTITF
ncbi:murein DD-endopeptidase MepM/ murein hydrolase activator NlpD [Dysgonomonadaceae bacterium PH5-43]|nr:murein DD-endopeptidase MepM/ murein hydrolase activator NlpD [Dysgonomonadaceae bacterium PH5-43]